MQTLTEAASHFARRQSLQAALIEEISRDYAEGRDLNSIGYNVQTASLDQRVQSLQAVCICLSVDETEVLWQHVDESFSAAYNKAAAAWNNV